MRLCDLEVALTDAKTEILKNRAKIDALDLKIDALEAIVAAYHE